MNDNSTPLTESQTLKTSSPTVELSPMTNSVNSFKDEDFLSEPLAGLTIVPFHEMTEAERREHVQNIRQLRQSFQTFKATVQSGATKEVKESKPKLDSAMDELFN